MLKDPLDPDLCAQRNRSLTARQRDRLCHVGIRKNLVDGRVVDASRKRNLGAHRRDENNVSGRKRHILGLIAMQQQIVQIEMNDRLARPLQFNVAQAALRQRSPRGEQRIQQGGKRADGVGSRTARLPHYEHLDRPQLAEIDAQVEVAKVAAQLSVQVALQLRVFDVGHANRPNIRKRDVARAVHHKRALLIHLPRKLDAEFVSRSDDVIARNWNIVHRGKGGGNVVKQRSSKDRQLLSGGLLHQALELRDGVRRALRQAIHLGRWLPGFRTGCLGACAGPALRGSVPRGGGAGGRHRPRSLYRRRRLPGRGCGRRRRGGRRRCGRRLATGGMDA